MAIVLVVDDSSVDRCLISGLLQKSPQLQVETAVSGADAVAKLTRFQPDLIVTDLTMPEMDGLQLVAEVRIHHPEVPIILVTAYGTEALAIQALEQGAASYVPKPQMGQKLLETVEQVLARHSANQTYERLTAAMTRADLAFRLPNDEALVERLVDLVQAMAVSMGLCAVNEQVRMGMAMQEALSAAMYQGNLEFSAQALFEARLQGAAGAKLLAERQMQHPFCARRIEVHVRLSPAEGRIDVRHEGPPVSAVTSPPPAALDDPANRTAVLLHAMMDEVHYAEDGRSVTLVKRPGTSTRGPT